MKLPIENLYAKNLKHKFSVWVNEEENIKVDELEEKFYIICDYEQGVNLDEEGNDVDEEFTEEIMNYVESSYQYEKENGDVDVRSIEDLKDCFVETNQYGMLEVKELVETEEPYVLNTNYMYLTACCTNERRGQLLNIVQQIREDEDEGGTMDMWWNVYVLNIYLLTLLHVL